jgi:hypothetical protein
VLLSALLVETVAPFIRLRLPETVVRPVSALLAETLEASARKASGPLSVSSLLAAMVVISPLANSRIPEPLALPVILTDPLSVEAVPKPAAPAMSKVAEMGTGAVVSMSPAMLMVPNAAPK